jgi:alkylhydroperoxidase/carboxymuconolactone decarboxylase family protein YurZ
MMPRGRGRGELRLSVDIEDVLRKLSIRDDAYVESVLSHDRDNIAASALDPRTHALVRVGALVAIDAAPPSYMWTIESAFRHGATREQIVGVLVAVMPAVGTARVVSAAPKVALALGFDVEGALERLPPRPGAR